MVSDVAVLYSLSHPLISGVSARREPARFVAFRWSAATRADGMWVWPQPRTFTLFGLLLRFRPWLEPLLERTRVDRERFRAALTSLHRLRSVTGAGG
jgi:hypothetical protein